MLPVQCWPHSLHQPSVLGVWSRWLGRFSTSAFLLTIGLGCVFDDFSTVSIARADTLSIHASGEGYVIIAEGRHVVRVEFPKTSVSPTGMKICSFGMVYKDEGTAVNTQIHARLYSRTFSVGSDPFAPASLLKELTSTNGVGLQRIVSPPVTVPPKIDFKNTFYFIQFDLNNSDLDDPADGSPSSIAVIGAQVDYRSTCPSP